MFESIQDERKPDSRHVLAKCCRQSVISAAAGNLEAEIADVGAEQYSGVVIESANLTKVDSEMLRKIQFFEDGIDFFEVVKRLNRPRVFHEPASFGYHGFAARQMRYCAQDVLAPVFDRKLLQEIFKARLVLDVQDIFELRDLVWSEIHSVDDSAEEIHASEIDLKIGNAKALQRLNGDQQNFDVGLLAGAEVFNSGIVNFPAPKRDLSVPVDLNGIRRVRFTSTADESNTPGLSEFQVISRPGGTGLNKNSGNDAGLDHGDDVFRKIVQAAHVFTTGTQS